MRGASAIRFCIPNKCLMFHRVIVVALFLLATQTVKSVAWLVICVRLLARLVAFPCRKLNVMTAVGFQSFSASISHVVFFAVCVKKPVQLRRFNLHLILKWQNLIAKIWFTRKSIY